MTLAAAKLTNVEKWERRPENIPYIEFPDVAVDADGLVYGLVREPGLVLVFRPDGSFVRKIGEGILCARPHGVTVGPDGRVWVVDEQTHTVIVFDAAGAVVQRIGTPGVVSDTGADDAKGGPFLTQTVKHSAGPFHNPTKVAFAADGSFYVSDGYGNARVHHFDPAGKLLHSWGEPGQGRGEFFLVHYVQVLRDGRILVCDRENDRIQLFTPGGEFLAEWAEFQRPTSAAEDAQGRIYVGELAYRVGETSTRHGAIEMELPARVTVVDGDGQVLDRMTELTGPGGAQALVAPHGIAVDSKGSLYIAEVSFSNTRRLHERNLQKALAAN
jgi:sugar lactone lactonase YvrE